MYVSVPIGDSKKLKEGHEAIKDVIKDGGAKGIAPQKILKYFNSFEILCYQYQIVLFLGIQISSHKIF